MTPEQFVAIVGGLTALLLAVAGVILQVRGLASSVNGRMGQLLKTVELAAEKKGELEGRDYERSIPPDPPAEPPVPEVRQRT